VVDNPKTVEKTIVYVDNKAHLMKARWTIIKQLMMYNGFTKPQARKLIRRYDASIRQADQDQIFADFKDPDGSCRIVVATVSLGMGMDLPDVERIVQFGLPPSPNLSDIWQRFRRAMRKREGQGVAYIFVPYWAFDRLGSEDKQPRRQVRPSRRTQQRLQPFVPAVRSGLRAMELVEGENDSDAASVRSDASVVSQDSEAAQAQQEEEAQLTVETVQHQSLFDITHRVKWTKQDLVQREKLSPVFMEWLNSPCFRKPILDYLQEPDDDDLEYKRPVEKDVCCNACNYALHRVIQVPPRDKQKDKPTETSVAGIAATLLSRWCTQRAQDLVPDTARRYDLAGEWWMDEKIQYEVARSFSKAKVRDGRRELRYSTVDEMREEIPGLEHWEYITVRSGGQHLLSFCLDNLDLVYEMHQTQKQARAARKKQPAAPAPVQQPPTPGLPVPTTPGSASKRGPGSDPEDEPSLKRRREGHPAGTL
jgi:hypothetical protein